VETSGLAQAQGVARTRLSMHQMGQQVSGIESIAEELNSLVADASASVVEFGDGVFEVKASAGDRELGGDDWDHAVVGWLVDQLTTDAARRVGSDLAATERLRQAATQAKEDLSSAQAARVQLPYLIQFDDSSHHLDVELTRIRFEELTAHLLDKMRSVVEAIFTASGLAPSDIDRVVLLGGASRMPSVQQVVAELTGHRELRVEPDETVARGAAIQHGVLRGKIRDVLLLDVASLSLGVEVVGSGMHAVIECNTTVPTRNTVVLTNGVDDQPALEIHVFQGQSALAVENTWLGALELAPLPRGRAGALEIDVTFDLDANNLLTVTALERSSQLEQSITIGTAGNLTAEQLSWMSAEAGRDVLDLAARPPGPPVGGSTREGPLRPRSSDPKRTRSLPIPLTSAGPASRL
jgi:molecular chaperone DnaK